MKRRLSIILSTIGNPNVLFLDEPTTGLDPVNRKFIWNIIKKLKNDRVIILTSHSMDEVEYLSDRIGIIVKGQFRCIGTTLEIKAAFGGQYVLKLSK
jgi:ABC-type multidrug transport system ATPase subunit